MWYLVLLLACGGPSDPDRPSVTDSEPTGTDTEVPPTTEPTVENPTGVLLINEVMSDNESSWQTTGDALPDWIELYNPGTAPIALSTVSLADDSGVVWRGGEGQIEVGERVVFAADGDVAAGHLPFNLDANGGDELTLMVGTEVADRVEIPPLPSDVSWARLPDGGPSWAATTAATPEAQNGDAPSAGLDAKAAALTDGTIHQLDFQMTKEQYDILNTRDENWAFSELTIDGIHFDKMDMRLKGSASFDLMDGKPAFKIDLNQYLPDRRFREMKGFKLHNGNVLDPTRTRDSLSYELARESGVMAPMVGWAEVYVNDTYYGIYMMIEDYDDDMIEEWYPGEKDIGAMFEPNEAQGGGFGWGDFCTGDVDFQYEEGPVPPDPLTLAALNNASATCGKAATDENVLALWNDVDKEDFLTYLAWETLVQHLDGYKAPNNWRVYVDAGHKVHLVPSGAEWTWDMVPQTWYFGGNLGDFCMQNTGCKRDYAVKLLEMADRVEALDLATRFDDLSAWLDPVIAADPRSPHGPIVVKDARQSTRSYILANPDTVRNDVATTFPGL